MLFRTNVTFDIFCLIIVSFTS